MSDDRFESWAILELFGHRRLAGFVTEVELGGSTFLRLDVPAADDDVPNGEGAVTQFYSPSALYCLTPTTEDIARAVAKRSVARPVHAFELAPPRHDESDEYDDGPY